MKRCMAYVVALMLMAGSAQAAIVATNDAVYGNQSAFAALSDDLLQSSALASFDGPSESLGYGSAGNLINGSGSDYFGAIRDWSTWSVTAYFDTTANTLGYDITSVATLAGWNDSRANQEIAVEYRLVGSSDFVALGTYSNSAATGGDFSTKILLTSDNGPMLSGVDAMRVTFSAYTNFKEVDVVGAATVVPEPVTMVTLAIGGIAAIARRRIVA